MEPKKEARLSPRKRGKCYAVVHRRLGQISNEFFSKLVGEVAIDNAVVRGQIERATATQLHKELRELPLPDSATQADIKTTEQTPPAI